MKPLFLFKSLIHFYLLIIRKYIIIISVVIFAAMLFNASGLIAGRPGNYALATAFLIVSLLLGFFLMSAVLFLSRLHSSATNYELIRKLDLEGIRAENRSYVGGMPFGRQIKK